MMSKVGRAERSGRETRIVIEGKNRSGNRTWTREQQNRFRGHNGLALELELDLDLERMKP